MVVCRYTNAWKVFRLGSTMRTVAKGKCALVLTVNDLTRAGSRHFRMKAFFVSNADAGVEWAKKKRGVAWSPGHVLQPAQGEQVLCRVLKAVWKVSSLPYFSGSTYIHESSERTVADRERAVAVRARVEGGKGVFGSNSKWEHQA